jgi:hypothetical protein
VGNERVSIGLGSRQLGFGENRGEAFCVAVDRMDDHFGNAEKGDGACNSRRRPLYQGLMRMSMNTTSSGGDWVDDIQGHPRARIGRTWRTRQDVRRYAAEKGIAEAAAIEDGLGEKVGDFKRAGSELYSKA